MNNLEDELKRMTVNELLKYRDEMIELALYDIAELITKELNSRGYYDVPGGAK